MPIAPLYLPTNCHAAWQLNWSLSVFGRAALPSPQIVLAELRQALENDGVRILEIRSRPPNVVQFFLSSTPEKSPSQLIRSVKGRWQHLSRTTAPIAFRRNYRITSVGSASDGVLNDYVKRQTERHPMADDRVQAMLEKIQFDDATVSLTDVLRSSHGEYRYALQIVLESDSGWHDTREAALTGYRQAIIGSCRKHNWRLKRIGILSNHLHILVGPGIDDSPEEVALVLLNNLAFTQGMKPLFRFSFYAGTFGEYDRGAIWNTLGKEGEERGSRPDKPDGERVF
jgi:hypothetical protein